MGLSTDCATGPFKMKVIDRNSPNAIRINMAAFLSGVLPCFVVIYLTSDFND